MTNPERPDEIVGPLLELLRRHIGRSDLAYAEEPSRLMGGNHTFVYSFRLNESDSPWNATLVLRILRSHRTSDEVEFESIVQNTLADRGVPAPRVLLHASEGPLGGAFQVMQRVTGDALILGDVGAGGGGFAMLKDLLLGFGETVFGAWPELLAAAHAHLHSVPIEPLIRALDEVGLRERVSLGAKLDLLARDVDAFDQQGLQPGVDWLREHEPRRDRRLSICHGDLFPNQVYAVDGRITGVIDWADACVAPAEVDVGLVTAGLAMVPVPIPGARWIQRRLVRRFRDAYVGDGTLDPGALRFGEVLRGISILRAIARFRAGAGPAPIPHEQPQGLAGILRHLAGNGIVVQLR
jgi:aminoglycoside phosphotransferase (APT) family kinase protein